MSVSGHQRWVGAALITGVLYLVAGLLFAALAGSAGSNDVRVAWRLAAWVTSAAAFAAHIGYEHVRLRDSPRTTAWHAAAAVALGAFGLAVAANIHAQQVASSHRGRLIIALAAWPALTAVPAFVAALVVAAVLARARRSA